MNDSTTEQPVQKSVPSVSTSLLQCPVIVSIPDTHERPVVGAGPVPDGTRGEVVAVYVGEESLDGYATTTLKLVVRIDGGRFVELRHDEVVVDLDAEMKRSVLEYVGQVVGVPADVQTPGLQGSFTALVVGAAVVPSSGPFAASLTLTVEDLVKKRYDVAASRCWSHVVVEGDPWYYRMPRNETLSVMRKRMLAGVRA